MLSNSTLELQTSQPLATINSYLLLKVEADILACSINSFDWLSEMSSSFVGVYPGSKTYILDLKDYPILV
jgi:hypothetical protein